MDKYNQTWVLWFAPEGVGTLWAVTLGQTAYYGCGKLAVTASWRRHENTHKAQWKREGRIKFAVTYLWYHFTRGYAHNPYELEAFAAE